MANTQRSRKIYRIVILCLLGFAIVNGAIIWRVRQPISEGYGDFASFYTAGKIVGLGQSARLYDPSLQWQVQQQFAANVKIRRGPLPYIRPPYQAVLFLPLSYLSYPVACWLWLTLKVAILLIIPCLLPAVRGQTHYFLKGLLCLSFFPVGFDLLQGQDSVLLLLIIVITLRLLLRQADALSGVVLALGLFKFHIIVPLFLIIIIALKRRTHFAVGFGAMASVLFLISLSMVHWTGVQRYPRYLWMLNQAPGLGMVVKSESMPNARGMLTALLGSGPLPAIAQWLLVAVVLAGIALSAMFWRDDTAATRLQGFAFSVAVVLVTSYYDKSYDLTLLLVPLLLLGEPFLNSPRRWPCTAFFVAAGVLACTPLLWVFVSEFDQFCWIGLVVAAVAASIWAQDRVVRRAKPVTSIFDSL